MSILETFQTPYGQSICFYPEVPPLTEEQMQKRSEKFEAELQKMRDTFASSGPSDLKAIRSQLSISSQRVLEQVKNGYKNVDPGEWTTLCRELKDFNLISSDDFDCAKAGAGCFVIGYYDKNGNYVNLPPSPEMDRIMYAKAGLLPPGSPRPASEWPGNPLIYLDRWIDSTESWLDDIVKMKNDDGSRKYPDVSPIKNQIDSYKKVSSLVQQLSKL